MSRIKDDPKEQRRIVSKPDDIRAYLLQSVKDNTKKKLGVEWEIFFLSREDQAPTAAENQQILEKLLASYSAKYGSKVKPLRNDDGSLFGISTPNGAVCLEPGRQVEFATIPRKMANKIAADVNEFITLATAAAAPHFQPVGKGFEPAYLGNLDLSRARYNMYYKSLELIIGPEQTKKFFDAMVAGCSLQVNIDAGGENFHEIYRCLLLLEPLIAFTNRNSDRGAQWVHCAGTTDETTGLGPQTAPICAAWDKRDNAGIIDLIVERMMNAQIVFLPDPEKGGEHYMQPIDPSTGKLKTLSQIITERPISERELKVVLGLMLHQPSLRRPGVLETRACDSLSDANAIKKLVTLYKNIIYDPAKRAQLLQTCAALNQDDIRQLHTVLPTLTDEDGTAMTLTGGKTVRDLVDFMHKLGGATPTAPRPGLPPEVRAGKFTFP